MKKVQIAAILLLCASLLAACGSEDGNEPGNTDAGTVGKETEDAGGSEKDGFFTALGKTGTEKANVHFLTVDCGSEIVAMNDIGTERETGAAMNDAIFRRNLEVEDRTGIKITYTNIDTRADAADKLRSATMAGDFLCDVANITTEFVPTLFHADCLDDLMDIPGLQLDKPWWSKIANDNFTLKNHLYYAISSVNHLADNVIWCVMFNKGMLSTYDLDDPYQLVRDGKWTIDVMYSMMKNVPIDSNGNGTSDWQDIYGCVGQAFDASALLTGTGCTAFVKDGNDIPVVSVNANNSVAKFEKVFEFINDKKRMMICEDYKGVVDDIWSSCWTLKFNNDEALFMFNAFGNLEEFTDMKSDFGIVPIPKYDEQQENYYCMGSPYFTTCLTIPKVRNASDADIGIALEAISYLSYVDVEPVFARTYLNNRFIRDEESVEMMRLISHSKYYDPAFAFNWGSATSIARTVAYSGTNTYASTLESKAAGITAALEETLSMIKD